MSGATQAQSTLYVDDSAVDAQTGLSWTDAYTDLQSALDHAASSGNANSEIRIAAGTYRPTAMQPFCDPSDPRAVTFQLKSGLALRGGYAGVTAANPDQRDIELYESILSADLSGDDGPNGSNMSDNAFHVIYAEYVDRTASLDGLTIAGGNAVNAATYYDQFGGGIYGSLADFSARDCKFINNSGSNGGALFLSNSNGEFRRCQFRDNRAQYLGGAVLLYSDQPIFVECTFFRNIATTTGGGAVGGHGHAAFHNCTFLENQTAGCGGALNVDGGHPLVSNSLLAGNIAAKGGAICNESWYLDTQIVGCTIAQNKAALGSAVYDDSSSGSLLQITNSIIWANFGSPAIAIDDLANRPRINFSCLQDGWNFPDDVGNIALDPHFVNPDGVDGIPGNGDDDFRLQPNSPCIDAADNLAMVADFGDLDLDEIFYEPTPLDLARNPRVIDQIAIGDTGRGFGPIVDMGAIETVADCNGNGISDTTDILNRTARDCDGNGVPDSCQANCNSNSVADACEMQNGLGEDCNLNGRMDVCDVYAGLSQDCNANDRIDECELTLSTSFDCNQSGLLDECDIESGASIDCDLNGVPDECEPDCNANAIVDACDIRDGASMDCNTNHVPDECDIRDRHSNDCNNDGIPNECQAANPALADNNANNISDVCEIAVLYVDSSAPSGGNGASWQAAYKNLSSALNHAYWAAPIVKKVLVADGVYRPATRLQTPDPRTATFLLPAGVELRGGLAGRGALDPNFQDPAALISLLDGDLSSNDLPGFVNRADNAYHVVSAIDAGTSGAIYGFTIRGGYANGPDPQGAGLYLRDRQPHIEQIIFTDHFAGRIVPAVPPRNPSYTLGSGAAIAYTTYEYTEFPATLVIANCQFSGNKALSVGGAVHGEEVSFSFRDCVFRNNEAPSGGAFGSTYDRVPEANFERCTFDSNVAEYDGGAVFMGYEGEKLIVLDCVIQNNEAHSGGGVYMQRGALTILNSLFELNKAEYAGGGIFTDLFLTEINIESSRFVNNRASSAGGALVRASQATVIDTVFENNAVPNHGGGLYNWYGHAQVDRCEFRSNSAGDKGGGLFTRGPLKVQRCIIERNSAGRGGGLYGEGDHLEVSDSQFQSNHAEEGGGMGDGSVYAQTIVRRTIFMNNRAILGGAISALLAEVPLLMTDCLVAQNKADTYAGGVAGGDAGVQLSRCTIANNTAGALGGGALLGPESTVDNSIFWGNIVDPQGENYNDESAQVEGLQYMVLKYSNVQGWSGDFLGIGMVNSHPNFLDPQYPSDSQAPPVGDYHVLSDSPVINAGDPGLVAAPGDSDLDGHARVLCGRLDMGAYESGIGDFDCDQQVDLTDFAYWNGCSTNPGDDLPFACKAFDYDADSDVDLADFARFQESIGQP